MQSLAVGILFDMWVNFLERKSFVRNYETVDHTIGGWCLYKSSLSIIVYWVGGWYIVPSAVG